MTAAAPRNNPRRKAFIAQRRTSDSDRSKEGRDETGISVTSLVRIFADFTPSGQEYFRSGAPLPPNAAEHPPRGPAEAEDSFHVGGRMRQPVGRRAGSNKVVLQSGTKNF